MSLLRLLFVIETTPDAMLSMMERNDAIRRLCVGEWVHLAVIDPDTSKMQCFRDGEFQPYQPPGTNREGKAPVVEVDSSLTCYEGSRDHLPFFSIAEGLTDVLAKDGSETDTHGARGAQGAGRQRTTS